MVCHAFQFVQCAFWKAIAEPVPNVGGAIFNPHFGKF